MKSIKFVETSLAIWNFRKGNEACMNDYIRFTQAAQEFANKAKKLASVQEVVLCGSMAAGDPYPGDIDLAVVLSNLDELPQLARFCRQISSITHAWEVFIFNKDRKYLGRICHKRDCPRSLSLRCARLRQDSSPAKHSRVPFQQESVSRSRIESAVESS
jgi:predicted nucleotidyltransferase